eukprot:scaffold1422_cov48-Attheya_sp.AAC.2
MVRQPVNLTVDTGALIPVTTEGKAKHDPSAGSYPIDSNSSPPPPPPTPPPKNALRPPRFLTSGKSFRLRKNPTSQKGMVSCPKMDVAVSQQDVVSPMNTVCPSTDAISPKSDRFPVKKKTIIEKIKRKKTMEEAPPLDNVPSTLEIGDSISVEDTIMSDDDDETNILSMVGGDHNLAEKVSQHMKAKMKLLLENAQNGKSSSKISYYLDNTQDDNASSNLSYYSDESSSYDDSYMRFVDPNADPFETYDEEDDNSDEYSYETSGSRANGRSRESRHDEEDGKKRESRENRKQRDNAPATDTASKEKGTMLQQMVQNMCRIDEDIYQYLESDGSHSATQSECESPTFTYISSPSKIAASTFLSSPSKIVADLAKEEEMKWVQEIIQSTYPPSPPPPSPSEYSPNSPISHPISPTKLVDEVTHFFGQEYPITHPPNSPIEHPPDSPTKNPLSPTKRVNEVTHFFGQEYPTGHRLQTPIREIPVKNQHSPTKRANEVTHCLGQDPIMHSPNAPITNPPTHRVNAVKHFFGEVYDQDLLNMMSIPESPAPGTTVEYDPGCSLFEYEPPWQNPSQTLPSPPDQLKSSQLGSTNHRSDMDQTYYPDDGPKMHIDDRLQSDRPNPSQTLPTPTDQLQSSQLESTNHRSDMDQTYYPDNGPKMHIDDRLQSDSQASRMIESSKPGGGLPASLQSGDFDPTVEVNDGKSLSPPTFQTPETMEECGLSKNPDGTLFPSSTPPSKKEEKNETGMDAEVTQQQTSHGTKASRGFWSFRKTNTTKKRVLDDAFKKSKSAAGTRGNQPSTKYPADKSDDLLAAGALKSAPCTTSHKSTTKHIAPLPQREHSKPMPSPPNVHGNERYYKPSGMQKVSNNTNSLPSRNPSPGGRNKDNPNSTAVMSPSRNQSPGGRNSDNPNSTAVLSPSRNQSPGGRNRDNPNSTAVMSPSRNQSRPGGSRNKSNPNSTTIMQPSRNPSPGGRNRDNPNSTAVMSPSRNQSPGGRRNNSNPNSTTMMPPSRNPSPGGRDKRQTNSSSHITPPSRNPSPGGGSKLQPHSRNIISPSRNPSPGGRNRGQPHSHNVMSSSRNPSPGGKHGSHYNSSTAISPSQQQLPSEGIHGRAVSKNAMSLSRQSSPGGRHTSSRSKPRITGKSDILRLQAPAIPMINTSYARKSSNHYERTHSHGTDQNRRRVDQEPLSTAEAMSPSYKSTSPITGKSDSLRLQDPAIIPMINTSYARKSSNRYQLTQSRGTDQNRRRVDQEPLSTAEAMSPSYKSKSPITGKSDSLRLQDPAIPMINTSYARKSSNHDQRTHSHGTDQNRRRVHQEPLSNTKVMPPSCKSPRRKSPRSSSPTVSKTPNRMGLARSASQSSSTSGTIKTDIMIPPGKLNVEFLSTPLGCEVVKVKKGSSAVLKCGNVIVAVDGRDVTKMDANAIATILSAKNDLWRQITVIVPKADPTENTRFGGRL